MERELINDGQEFRGAADRFGHSIPTYDDSWGRLWILRDSLGILGIVRARTTDDAWGIAEDEFFPEATAWSENDLFQEAYGFRPNGPNSRDHVRHGIYARDLNGEYLDALTPALLAELGITLDIIDAQAD